MKIILIDMGETPSGPKNDPNRAIFICECRGKLECSLILNWVHIDIHTNLLSGAC